MRDRKRSVAKILDQRKLHFGASTDLIFPVDGRWRPEALHPLCMIGC
jgi:hypothetical protein